MFLLLSIENINISNTLLNNVKSRSNVEEINILFYITKQLT